MQPIVTVGKEATFVMLPEAMECPACHRMAMFVVNREGRTVCMTCDQDRKPK